MKNIKSALLCLGVLSLSALPSHAVLIRYYPGLDKLSDEADTIAIVRIESSNSPGMMIDGWTRRRCFVYQSLKGSLKPNQLVWISLNDFVGPQSNFGGQSLAPMTTHLVFLNHSKQAVNGANYSIVCDKGADLLLSPLGNETKPKGKTLKAQIQTLIGRYKIYRDEQMKKEDVLLDEALGE